MEASVHRGILNQKEIAKLTIGNNGSFSARFLTPQHHFNGELVFVKKNYDKLLSLGSNLDLAVDFGILGILAVPILRGLQFFYEYVRT